MKHIKTRFILVAGFISIVISMSAFAEPDLKKLEGEYVKILPGFSSNDSEAVTGGNSLEIMPVSSSSAYFHTLLYFDDGYQCEASGIAKADGNDLLYHEHTTEGTTGCVLRLHVTRNRITFSDKEDTCLSTCGAHGLYDGEWFARKSRKPIADPEKFKSSEDFTRVMEESKETDQNQKP